MPNETNSLLDKLGDKGTYSVAINDVYFENATAAFRQAGLTAATAPVIVGAGDGDASALQRIRSGDYQAATVPSPLRSEGWQIIDELNRSFAGEKASGYVPQVHVSTKENATDANSWDPVGFQDAYKKLWGQVADAASDLTRGVAAFPHRDTVAGHRACAMAGSASGEGFLFEGGLPAGTPEVLRWRV